MNQLNLEAELEARGLTLPAAPKPIAAYVPAVRTQHLLFVSGQLPTVDGELIATGKVGRDLDVAAAQAAARQCLLNGLAVIRNELAGDWTGLVRVVRLGVFVQSDDGFYEQAKVANGASELLGELLGDAGRHARAAIGVNALPLNSPVELEITCELRRP